MATILLSAAGAALGGSIGGSLAGLSMMTIGRAVGASLGRVIDQRLLGGGAEAVETGRVDRFRLGGAGEGAPLPQVFGRMRIGAEVIWASPFGEHRQSHRGGKGGFGPRRTEYSYSVSLALGLCEGVIGGVGRIWADGTEIAPDSLNMRVYHGDPAQPPDALIEVYEGVGRVPGFRGTAYVVIEDLDLGPFGNRVPSFNFEVLRPDFQQNSTEDAEPAQAVRAVALMPGTGEYALATTPVRFDLGLGEARLANVNSLSGKSDLETSLGQLAEEFPKCAATSLIVTWFGDDLRCDRCQLRPKVEQGDLDGAEMPWQVAGLDRLTAGLVPQSLGRPTYGGTPSDQSVLEAIAALNAAGQAVMYYPFVLMEQLKGNGLTDPWSGAEDQPVLPWRGRITASMAPGQEGSPDGTAAMDAEVATYFGTASADDFTYSPTGVTYQGPSEWSYRRFILHNAALCAAAGGVEAFCIGSEMRGLTSLRGAGHSFPAVAQLQALAAEVRQLLGPDCRIGYAADWSEYFGHHPQDGTGNVYFHLDPLWADENIDFIGIDNYMPLSDWRDGEAHADAGWGSLYDLGYLRSNIEGGEGFDWHYPTPEAREAQRRVPITDGAFGEPWVFRYKDLRGWWTSPHHNRIGGERQAAPTPWIPRSKPIWFTELGCAAVDKGSNQPNKFLDPKSSESSLPYYSNGQRDALMQMQYLRALLGYWSMPGNNPMSDLFAGRMLTLSRMFVWAWDARPYPVFPRNDTLWNDAGNYARGHWLNGRGSGRSLASVVTEICQTAGVSAVDTRRLWGYVQGYVIDQVGDARTALQPLMLRHGFDAIERDGSLVFRSRNGQVDWALSSSELAEHEEVSAQGERLRSAQSDMVGRVRLRFVEAGADFEVISEEAVLPDEESHGVAASEMAMALTRAEGRQVVERWLSEARQARDTLQLALPPSCLFVGAGDVLSLPEATGVGRYRVDRIEYGSSQLIEAVRIDPESYQPAEYDVAGSPLKPFVSPSKPFALFLDLPLLKGDELPHAPHLALSAKPWPGPMAIYHSDEDNDYALLGEQATFATLGVTETPLRAAGIGRWDLGQTLQVRLANGSLESRNAAAVLAGRNLAAIGDGSAEGWEVIQFQRAELIGPEQYRISQFLRGQQGSDSAMPDVWPEGSFFVLLDRHVPQLKLAAGTRGLARHYRIGPALRGYDDPSYGHHTHAFGGIGLRPYAPVHLTVEPGEAGDLSIRWIRRSRIDADSWDGADVPLGEEREAYLLRITSGSSILRQVTLDGPEWSYALTAQQADQAAGPLVLRVAQISARYGPGAEARLDLTPFL